MLTMCNRNKNNIYMTQYPEKESFSCSVTQKQTLAKIKGFGYNKSKFIRDAIAEKIKREHPKAIVKPDKIKVPF